MSDLSNSVILPREDFLELQAVAWNQPAVPTKERVASTVQTSVIFAAMALAVTAGTWGYAWAINWREKKALERAMTDPKYQHSPKL